MVVVVEGGGPGPDGLVGVGLVGLGRVDGQGLWGGVGQLYDSNED